MSPSSGDRTAGGFSGLGLIDKPPKAVGMRGYEEPTPVQRETIPLMLASRDLLAQAATGTGKTAAFALPMIQALGQDSGSGLPRAESRGIRDSKGSGVRGVVLVPTRELAMQV